MIVYSIDVTIVAIPTNQGGRKSFLFTGYRANCTFPSDPEGAVNSHDALLTLRDAELLYPGHSGSGSLLPLHPHYWEAIKEGDTLRIREGTRIVAVATVVRVNQTRPMPPEC